MITSVSLSELVTIRGGGTPDRQNPDYWNGNIPWASVKDLKDIWLENTQEFITENGVNNSATNIIPTGTVVVVTRMAVGRACITKMPVAINQDLKALFCSSKLLPQYLLWFLIGASDKLEAQASGATVKGIKIDALNQLKIPFPPLEEQRRIAAILDKADAVRRKRQSAIALTEELLRSAFLEMFGDPVTNPKGWKVESLGEIATFLGGGTPSRKQPKYYEGDICWASSKDMSVDVLVDTEEHITKEAIDNSSTKLVNVGVLLVVVKSKILMRRLPVARTEVNTCFNQDIKAIAPHNLSITRYIHRHIKLGQETLLRQARGVNTEGLTLEHLRNYKVMTPPAPQVNKFVELEKSLERSLSTNQKAAKESQNLFNSLLQKAFQGEL